MSKFIEKHKRKSALAALLLLLRSRRTALIMLILVAMLMMTWVAPSSLLFRFPAAQRAAAGITWLAARSGIHVQSLDQDPSFKNLLSAFKTLRADDSRQAALFSLMYAASGAYAPGRSSLDFLGSGIASFPSRVTFYKGRPHSIKGILTREESAKIAEESELTRALYGSGGVDGGSLPGASEILGDEAVSLNHNGILISGTAGHISAGRAAALSLKTQRSLNQPLGKTALLQLAYAHRRGKISKASGHPREYAAINMGSAYDGNNPGAVPQMISAPALDNAGVGLTQGSANNQSQQDAAVVVNQIAQCESAMQQYSGAINGYSNQIQSDCNKFRKMNCQQNMSIWCWLGLTSCTDCTNLINNVRNLSNNLNNTVLAQGAHCTGAAGAAVMQTPAQAPDCGS